MTWRSWIDAVMRQRKGMDLWLIALTDTQLTGNTAPAVRLEGWIHHLARHSVACFLTRGQCFISWERGAEVFDGKSACVRLVDGTVSLTMPCRIPPGLGSGVQSWELDVAVLLCVWCAIACIQWLTLEQRPVADGLPSGSSSISHVLSVAPHGRQFVVNLPAVLTHCLDVAPLQIAFMALQPGHNARTKPVCSFASTVPSCVTCQTK